MDKKLEGREHLDQHVRGEKPLFWGSADPDEPNNPVNRQPMNIPALVWSYLADTDSEPGKMRTFTIRVEESDHTRLTLLAEVMGTSKTTLARELLSMAMREATHALPDEVAEELRRKLGEV